MMHIGIVGYFDPSSVSDYFDDGFSLPKENSNASSVNAIVRGFLMLGHKVTVFTTYNSSGDEIHLSGKCIDIYMVSCVSKYRKLQIFSRMYMVRELKCLIGNHIEGIDVLHAQWTYDFALAAKFFTSKIPVFCTVRDWCPYLMSLAKSPSDKLFWIVSWFVFKVVMADKHIHFVANSEYTKRMVENSYSKKTLPIIHNPVMKESILLTRNKYPNNCVFVSISQNLEEPRKNFLRLLEAFSKFKHTNKDSELVLIGTYSDALKTEWKNLGLLDGVILCGKLERVHLFEQLDNASCLIHPSLEETFGNVLLEGMARRIPCIGGRESGAVPSVLGNGEYGILCDVGNVDSLCSAMCSIKDKRLMECLVEKSSRYLIENFSNDVVAQKHINLYKLYL